MCFVWGTCIVVPSFLLTSFHDVYNNLLIDVTFYYLFTIKRYIRSLLKDMPHVFRIFLNKIILYLLKKITRKEASANYWNIFAIWSILTKKDNIFFRKKCTRNLTKTKRLPPLILSVLVYNVGQSSCTGTGSVIGQNLRFFHFILLIYEYFCSKFDRVNIWLLIFPFITQYKL